MPSGRHQVFISYSWKDADVAGVIQRELEDADLDVWIDRDQIKPGGSFVAGMNSGLSKAAYVVLLCSPASLESKWVTREWMSTLANDDIALVPVKIAAVEMPQLLKDLLYIDLLKDFDSGLERLVRFLHDELASPEQLRSRVTFHATTVAPPDSCALPELDLRRAQLHEIRKVAKRCMDRTALREFCFDVQLEEGSLRGESLHEQLIDLLHTLNRDEQLERFAEWLQSDRRPCVSSQLKKLRAS